jgi:2-dehydro-3-deoxy-D-arabinonate dehydratase
VQLIRYRASEGVPRVGVLDGDRVRPLPGVATMAELLARPLTWIRGACETCWAADSDVGDTAETSRVSRAAQAGRGGGPGRRVFVAAKGVLAPVDGATEVWAASDYERSMHARVQENLDSADTDRVYAPRPELFFKSAAWRVAGPGDRVNAGRFPGGCPRAWPPC